MQNLRRIKRALISVSDKTGLAALSQVLDLFGVEIISTGGTATTLRSYEIAVREVADVTGFPEMMDGRLKTIHPKIAGGLLGIRDNPKHIAVMAEHGIEPIDLLVVNLYPFEDTIAKKDVTIEEAIEKIDIGGPNMIRAGLKNFESVAVVCNPKDYSSIMDEMSENEGQLSMETRKYLFDQGFQRTAEYDAAIHRFFKDEVHVNDLGKLYRASAESFL